MEVGHCSFYSWTAYSTLRQLHTAEQLAVHFLINIKMCLVSKHAMWKYFSMTRCAALISSCAHDSHLYCRCLKPHPASQQSAVRLFIQSVLILNVACPNCTKFNTALPWVPRNTPAMCEVNWMNGCGAPDRERYRQRDTQLFLYSQ